MRIGYVHLNVSTVNFHYYAGRSGVLFYYVNAREDFRFEVGDHIILHDTTEKGRRSGAVACFVVRSVIGVNGFCVHVSMEGGNK